MAPTIFIVPGIYEGPSVFEPLKAVLAQSGYNVQITSLPSTGTKSPGNPTMDDDAAAIAKDLEQVVEESGADGVVALMHSAGAFLGSQAAKGLTAPARQEAGKPGGLQKIVFLAGGILPEGAEHHPLPFFEFDEAKTFQRCKDSLSAFFNDLQPAEAEKWNAVLQHQPADWDRTAQYCGWKDVPSTYIITEQDQLLPPGLQEDLAALAGSKVVRVQAGHMAQLSKTDDVARLLIAELSS